MTLKREKVIKDYLEKRYGILFNVYKKNMYDLLVDFSDEGKNYRIHNGSFTVYEESENGKYDITAPFEMQHIASDLIAALDYYKRCFNYSVINLFKSYEFDKMVNRAFDYNLTATYFEDKEILTAERSAYIILDRLVFGKSEGQIEIIIWFEGINNNVKFKVYGDTDHSDFRKVVLNEIATVVEAIINVAKEDLDINGIECDEVVSSYIFD